MEVRLASAPIALSAAVLAILLLLVGCGTNGSSKNPATATLVMFDLSKSTAGAARQRYLAVFERILRTTHGEIAADVIDNNPLAHSGLPIEEYLPSPSFFSDNKLIARAKRLKAERTLTGKARTVLARRAGGSGTAILDSLTLAQNYFDSFPTAKTKYLIFLSDMVEESPRYRLTLANLRPGRVLALIRHDRVSHALPNLRGVEVYVAGAGVTRVGDLPARRVLAIKQLWLKYFAATGARLPAYRYGPTLIRYP